MTSHRIGTREEWAAARAELLEREKELTRMGDELARQRRELPWVPVEKEYTLQTADGTRTLAELFDGRSQLMVYHFMFGPHYEAGCPACSSTIDGYFSEGHGVSAFARDGDGVYHCYSSYARGTEFLMGHYAILDRAPKGRDEGDQPMGWLRRHDEYASE